MGSQGGSRRHPSTNEGGVQRLGRVGGVDAVNAEMQASPCILGFFRQTHDRALVLDMAVRFTAAASRAWIDAEALFLGSRHGTPDHLYGVAAECALKAVLVGLGAFPPSGPTTRRPWMVHVNKLWAEYSGYVSGLAGRTTLVPGGPNPFSGWLADHRYEEDATFSVGRVAAHRGGAQTAMAILERARVDGVVR